MRKKHERQQQRTHTFREAWHKLDALGSKRLTTKRGTPFVARAAMTTRAQKEGERVIRYFQNDTEFGRCYECCWPYYFNCNGTRVGMYSRAVDEYIGSSTPTGKLTRQELLDLVEQNGGPEGLDLSDAQMSGLNLGSHAIAQELKRRRVSHTEDFPAWVYVANGELQGINLQAANLTGANLQEADLNDANLQEADLTDANLQEAGLILANLQEADLTDANLQGAYLWFANLQAANLTGANLQEAELMHTNLQEADMTGANLQEANLTGANLQEAVLPFANLQEADMTGANLQEAILHFANLQEADMTGANLQEADMTGANLQEADMTGANLREVDLTVSKRLDAIRLFRARLERTNVTKGRLGQAIGEEKGKRYYEAKEAYLALKNNFDSIGRYDDASWAYIKERKMEKAMNHPRLAREYYATEDHLPEDANWRSEKWWWFYFKHTLRWTGDWLVELVCGYGESFLRVLGTLALVYLLFTLGYGVTWSVIRPTTTPDGITNTFTSSPVDWAIFSLGALTTMDPTGLEPRNSWVQLAAGIEALLGIFLTGLLGFVVANRIRRS